MAAINKTLSRLLLAACLAVLSVASYCALIAPLTHDEAYLLQAADSLSKGDGWASYGVMKGDGPWLFDPHITTGPVTLAPLSAVWRITGDVMAVRAFMLVFLYLSVAGLFCLFQTKKEGLLLPALAVGSYLSIVGLPAGRVEGELAAAAALVWSAYAIRKKMPLTAALLAGLAVQIKLVFALAGAVLLLAWAIPALFTRRSLQLKALPQAIAAYFLFSAPTIAFELWRLLSFADVNSWMASLDEFRYFLRSQNINTTSSWLDTQTLGEKCKGFSQVYPLSAWAAGAICALLIFVWAALRPYVLKLRYATPASRQMAVGEFPLMMAAGLIVCGAAMLAGWITQSAYTGSRQSLPFFSLFMPSLFALGGYCYCKATSCAPSALSTVRRFVLASMSLCLALLIGALAGRTADILQYEIAENERLRGKQSIILDIIRDQNAESMFVDTSASEFWQNAVFQILSPIQAVPVKTGRAQIMIVSAYVVRLTKTRFEDYLGECGDVLHQSKHMLLCRLPDFKYEDVNLQFDTWGPKQTASRIIPYRQPQGGAGFWIKTKPVDRHKIGPLRLYLSDRPAFSTHFDGELITGQFPARHFRWPGEYQLQVKQLARGRVFDVGRFHVLGEVGPIISLPDAIIAELVAWGPRQGKVGAGFRSQAGERSALWFRFADINQYPYEIHFGMSPLRTEMSGNKNLITASATKAQAEQLTANPGEIPVHLVDLVHGSKQLLGYFRVDGR